MIEVWKDIPEYVGLYQASSDGRVRSVDRVNSAGRRLKGRVLRDAPHPKGYRNVTLSRDGRTHGYYVHTLVARTFHGPQPSGLAVRHLNGDPSDNRPVNLKYGTYSENNLDMSRHGTHNNGSKTHCPQGHEYTDQNTYNEKHRKARRCRTCMSNYGSKYFQARGKHLRRNRTPRGIDD